MSRSMPHLAPAARASRSSRALVQALLQRADIRIDGARPWDMRVHDAAVFDRMLAQGSLGLGESYMAGAWDCAQLDGFFDRLLRARLHREVQPALMAWHALRVRLFNRQRGQRAWAVGEAHYDLGNDVYAAMLDPWMAYSCGYWAQADTLNAAQEAKLDLVCRKLGLDEPGRNPGMRLLDIGCGWGSLMAFAARRYGVSCIGVTVSREQAAFVRERHAGLPIEVRLQDYRDLDPVALGGRVDRIASIGMFEHVGRRNHRAFMQVVERCLAPEGLALLHTIGRNRRDAVPDPWIDRYIFPNGDLPSLRQVGDALDGLLVAEDVHNFGADYDRTLMAWHANFEAAWPRLAAQLGETFHRMWRYYLLSCAGAFRARELQLWQWVLSPRGVRGGWRRPRDV